MCAERYSTSLVALPHLSALSLQASAKTQQYKILEKLLQESSVRLFPSKKFVLRKVSNKEKTREFRMYTLFVRDQLSLENDIPAFQTFFYEGVQRPGQSHRKKPD